MTVDAMGNTPDSTGLFQGSLSPYVSGGKEMGRDQFLTLLVAQLRNQDPLNPMDSTQFTEQLAQFSSLEQLFGVNENLASLNTSQGQSGRAQAIGYIGKEIVARGDQLTLGGDNGGNGGFEIDEPADCEIYVLDAYGTPIRQISMGRMPAGQHVFEWDGRTDDGAQSAPGVYGFEVQAVDDSGAALPATKQVTGRVDRLNMEGSAPVLYVGNIPVGVSDVMDVRM